jgi:hypothetical protein
MKQFLHTNCKLHFSKARLFLLLLFSLFYFEAFSQSIQVSVSIKALLIYSDPNQPCCVNQIGGSYYSGATIYDCYGTPDIVVRNRVNINGNPFDYNFGEEDIVWIEPSCGTNEYAICGWKSLNPVQNIFLAPIGGIALNSYISIEQNAFEDDNFACTYDDADCGGYQTILATSTIMDRFPICGETYRDSQYCSSDGDSKFWGLEYFVAWYWDVVLPGSIESTKYICQGNDMINVKSIDVGTTHSTIEDSWEISTNNSNWTTLPSTTRDSVLFDPSSYASPTIYVRRKKTYSQCVSSGNVKSNVCVINVISPPTIPATATPSQTTADCGSFTLTNPIDPLNNTVPFHWEFQTSLNNGSSWLASVYSMPTINSNNTTANRTVCIRLRAIYDYNCDTIPWQSYCWFQYANPKAPTINTMYPDPATPLLCNGDGGVWATFNSGTGNGSNQYQYTVNGTTWLAYTPGQVIPVPINRDIEIRGRRVASAPSCNTTAWSTLAFWPRNTIVGPVGAITAPSLNTKTPNTASVCRGTDVSATINPGSGGGPRPNTQREFSIDGGTTWNTYTSGATIATTNAVDSVLIRARRNDGYGTAPLYRLHCSTDWQVIAKWDVINPLVSLQSFSMPLCYAVNPFADIAASDPTPGLGTWSIQNGTGSLSSTSSLNPIVTGLTAGNATTIRWSVTQSGCTRFFDTTIIPIATSIANLTNGGLCQTCPVKNGNSYNFYDNTGKLMAKIDDLVSPIAELGNTEVCVGIDTIVQNLLTNLGSSQAFLQRHFSIKPVTNTNTTVTLYFTATEFNNLKTISTSTPFEFSNVNQLIVSKFPNGGNDSYSLPNTAGGTFITPAASGFDAANGYYFVTIPVSTFSTFYIHPISGLPAVLPVELTYFTAACESNRIKIDWQTASENNNHHFEIERSDNAADFTKIISVPTQNGNSNQPQNYLVYDNEPKNAQLYYRLKQIDKDGKFTNSKTVAVNCQYSSEKNIVVSVYPNPTEDVLKVFINSIEDVSAMVKVYDLNMSLVFQNQIEVTNGNNLVDISLHNVSQGMYFVEISNSNGVLYKNKIIKQ